MAKYHYVYALTDPRKFGALFYIGKGSGDRKQAHFRSVSKEMAGGEASDKFKIIAAIRAEGLQPAAIVLSHHDDEGEALQAERDAIAEYGLDKLVNKSGGGEGVHTTKKPRRPSTRGLSQKQERFCELFVAGKTGSATDCYKEAYDVDNMAHKTVSEAASRLLAKPKIIDRLEVLRAPIIKQTKYDLKWCLQNQEQARDLAEETGNAGAMTGAVREIGKLGGIYPSEKQELTFKADDLALRLQQGRQRLLEEDKEYENGTE